MSERNSERARSWCFTHNNYEDVDQQRLRDLGGDAGCSYLIFGRERGGVTGTRHLQGYVQFLHAKTQAVVRRLLGGRAHVERSHGTPTQAADYCKKEADFEEFGTPPVGAGARNDLTEFTSWAAGLTTRPDRYELIRLWPNLWVRSGHRLWDIVDAFLPPPQLVSANGILRPWQQELVSNLSDGTDDRTITFYVDYEGNTGKSYMCRYLLTTRIDVQVLRIGKRDDLAHAIDQNKKVFLIDVPRSQMEFLQYSVLEMMKDRTVFSPKYHSVTKVLLTTPFVIVFCNEDPDMSKLSADRYDIKHL